MSNQQRPIKVFICHAHSDKNAARDLYVRLTRDGVDAWLDKEKLLPGQDWELEIRRAVRASDAFVVCLSRQFNEAGFRQKEVRLALDAAMEKPEGEIYIIPARLEECELPESLRKLHQVDLFEEDGYDKLVASLRLRAMKIGVPAPSAQPVTAPLSRVELLEREAIRYELMGDFWNALQTYYKIKKLDPAFPRLDIKIRQMEKEIEPKPSRSSNLWPVALGGLLLLIVAMCYGGYRIFSPLLSPTPTQTPTNSPTPLQTGVTGMPCADEPADQILELGRVVTGAICPVGDTDTFHFSGNGGEKVRIQVTFLNGTMRPCIELLAPDATNATSAVACQNAFENVIDVTLDQTGTYTIVVDVWFGGDGSYNLVVQPL
jgi:hypothetical protein